MLSLLGGQGVEYKGTFAFGLSVCPFPLLDTHVPYKRCLSPHISKRLGRD